MTITLIIKRNGLRISTMMVNGTEEDIKWYEEFYKLHGCETERKKEK